MKTIVRSPLTRAREAVAQAIRALEVEVVLVDPTLAATWLGLQRGNRKMRRRKKDRLAKIIEEGRWFVGIGTVVFDAEGVLIDGQHRLAAIIQAGQAVELLVVRGVDPDAKYWIDTGTVRSGGDALDMAGFDGDTGPASTALSLLLRYKRVGHINSMWTPENEDLRDGMLEHPDIVESVEATKGARTRAIWGSHGVFAFMHYVLHRQDSTRADEFFRAVLGGLGIDSDLDPRHLLRTRLMAEATAKSKVSPEYVVDLTFKAWNLWRGGQERQQLRVRKRGPAQEGFVDIGPVPGIWPQGENGHGNHGP